MLRTSSPPPLGNRLLPLRIPQLNPNHVLLAPGLMGGPQAISRDSAKIAAFRTNQILDSAHILARYGAQSVEAFKQIDRQARGYLFEDLRRRDQMTFPELHWGG